MKKNLFFYSVITIITIEIFTPIIYQNGFLPDSIRWVSHIINLVLFILLFIRFVNNKISIEPLLFFLAVVFLSVIVSISNHQDITATLWGIWIFSRYPIIGFLASSYEFSATQYKKVATYLLFLLFSEIIIQIFQYSSGIKTWDNLGGSFFIHGTGALLFVLLLIIVFFFGNWIVYKKSGGLIVAVVIGMISSVFGEMKLFFFALIFIGLLAIAFYMRRNGVNKRLIIAISVIACIVIAFPSFIDRITYVRKGSVSFLQQITDLSFIKRYTTFSYVDVNGNYDIGRNYAIRYVLNLLSTNNTRLIFGDGIGSRGVSRSLDSIGSQIMQGDLGLFTGSSLVIFLGEMGILSLAYIAVFLIFTIVRCFKIIRLHSLPYLISVSYSVLLFSVFWPVWLWYNTSWTLPGSMPFYWFLWGVVLRYSSTHYQRGVYYGNK